MRDETVVLVHGLWMNGLDMSLLQRRLQQAGFITRRFKYPTVNATPADNAQALQQFIQGIPSDTVHFVAHSLGGLVIRHLFDRYPAQKPGRIVTLGTPHQFSQAARQLSNYKLGQKILGRSTDLGLLGNTPTWNGSHALGVIAGNLRFGMGTIIRGIPKPNDGTVAVEETRLASMTDHIVLPVSHFGLLLSKQVAEQTIQFLRFGQFSRNSVTGNDN